MYWRVEGSLLELTTVRSVAFFTWNAQTFLERWVRRGLVLLMALLRPFLYAIHRAFATRVLADAEAVGFTIDDVIAALRAHRQGGA